MAKDLENYKWDDAGAYDGRNLSYASPLDPWFKRNMIRFIETISGRNTILRIYRSLLNEGVTPWDVWGRALEKLDIKMDYDEAQLAKTPKEGPVIFVANHPFGVIDGAILLHLATRVRKDYFLLINEVLSHEPFLTDHLLPIDFRNAPDAKATNEKTKVMTTERLRNGEVLLIFPSGGVATRTSFFSKEVTEFRWNKFIGDRIHETQCSIMPLYFHGENSWLFHFVSKLSMNLRLGLLLREIFNKRGKTFRIEIGDPIHYDEMKQYGESIPLINYLRERTMALGPKK
ncbi:MAG: lysophospholipid acyltransferase family protein [Bacteroidota bacterium]